MEHLQHFGLARDPFCNEPLLELFMETGPHLDALRRLDRGVRQSKGLCVLTGPVGAGKTMVVRRLLEDLEEEVFEAGMLVVPNGTAGATWLLSRFARQLGIEAPSADREALLAEIFDRLAIVREDGRHTVLIIDDAQALSSSEALAEVCGLLKLEYEERRLLSLVLAGDPPLAEMMASDPFLAHRADIKVEIPALDSATGIAYLTHRVHAAGGAVAILEEAAIEALHRLGQGLPGRINTLADNALFEAFLHNRRQMTGADVEHAWRSLSWNGAAEATAVPAPVPAPAPARPVAPEPTGVDPVDRSMAASTAAILPDTPEVLPPPPREPTDEAGLDALDSELEAAFVNGPGVVPVGEASPGAAVVEAMGRPTPTHGPPKEEDDLENLLVELIDD